MFVFVTSLSPLIFIICAVATFVKIDPLIIYVVITEQEIELKLIHYLIKTIRIVLITLFGQGIAIGIKLCLVLSFSMAVSFKNITKVVSIRHLSFSNIFIYKQLIVEKNIIKGFEKSLTSVGLFSLFVFLVISINGAIIAWKLNRIVLFLFTIIVLLIALGLLVITFDLCCSTYENSVKIQANWAIQLTTVSNYARLFLRKLVLSCKLLSIPAGYVGIIDKEIKINYFKFTVDATINLLIFVLSLLPMFK